MYPVPRKPTNRRNAGKDGTDPIVLAAKAYLSTGIRILDASDFKAWLIELADRAEAPETVESVSVEVETNENRN